MSSLADYKEIGELYTDRKDAVLGTMINRNSDTKKTSLLSPDSDRLLYNYFSNPMITDCGHFEKNNNFNEKFVFIGKNIITVYDVESGNFYLENPKKLLLPLLIKNTDEGGLDIDTNEDLEEICLNLTYLTVGTDNKAYIISYDKTGKPVLFKFDPYDLSVSNVKINEFNSTVGNSMLYCKPFVFNNVLFFLSRNISSIQIYAYNIFNDEWGHPLTTTLTSLISSFNSLNLTTKDTITVLIDNVLKNVYFIACGNTNSIKVYNYGIDTVTITDQNLNLSGRKIIQSNLYSNQENTSPFTYIVLLLDDNSIKFISRGLPNFSTITYTFTKSCGITGLSKVLFYKNKATNIDEYGFYVYVKTEDNEISAIPLKMKDILSNSSIDVYMTLLDESKTKYAFLTALSNTVNIKGNLFLDKYNIIYGSYIEAGREIPLIKDFGVIGKKYNSADEYTAIHGRNFRTGLEKDSSVSIVKNLPFGESQLSRLRLYPESISTDTSVGNEKNIINIKETLTDSTEYTTGEFIWKHLDKLGLPYNTHVKTVGRIIIDGYNLPIENTLITRKADNESAGDILFTFDKRFDISIIQNSLSDGIVKYPGALFFKNKGFLQNAIISNSYDLEGSLIYNDTNKGKLFTDGIHSITSSCIIDNVIVIGTNFGAIASINILTGAYTSISGNMSGDNPPCYFMDITSESTKGKVIYLTTRKNKVFAVFNNGSIYSTEINNSVWTRVANYNLDIEIPKCVCENEDVLFVSTDNGSINLFDMITSRSILNTESNKVPYYNDGTSSVYSSCNGYGQVSFGNKIYFIAEGYNDTTFYKGLCWFDTESNMFGKVNSPSDFYTNHAGAELATDGYFIYIIGSSGSSKKFTRYNPIDDVFESLQDMPYITRRNGVYTKDDKLIVLLTTNGTNNIHMVYNFSIGKWITHVITNGNNVPSNLREAKSVRYIRDTDKRDVVRVFYGKTTQSAVTYNTISSVFIEIDLDTDDIRNNTSFITPPNMTTKYFGNNVYMDGNKIYISGGIKYKNASAVPNTDLILTDINFSTIERTFPKVSNFSNLFGNRFGNYIFEFGGITSFTTSDRTKAVFCFDTRTGKYSTVNNLVLQSNIENNSLPIISCMKVVEFGSRKVLVMSRIDGSIASIDMSTGEYTPSTYDKARCRTRIFAEAGEVSKEGATSIDQIDNDIYFSTPSKTIKFAGDVGVFFSKNIDYPNTQCNIDYKVESIDTLELKTLNHLTGSSKVTIGKYIVFLNGFDNNNVDWRSSVHRGSVVYDSEFNCFSKICPGITDIYDNSKNVLARVRYNAVSKVINDYIYTFGGISKLDEETESNGSVVVNTVYRRTNSIERYDIITGEITEIDATFGFENFIIDKHFAGQTFRFNKRCFIGSKEIRSVSNFSQTKIFDVSANEDIVQKDRYLISFITMNDITEATVEEYVTSSSKRTVGTNCLFLFDTYTENYKMFYNDGVSNNIPISIGSDKVVVPIERYIDNDNVFLYLVIYGEETIEISLLRVIGSSYNLTQISSFNKSGASFKRGIVNPIYDKTSDSILIPDAHIGKNVISPTVASNYLNNPIITNHTDELTGTLEYNFKDDSFDIISIDSTPFFNNDNGRNAISPIYRLTPILDTVSSKCLINDVKYRIKKINQDIDRRISYSTGDTVIEGSNQSKLIELFFKSIKENYICNINGEDNTVYSGLHPLNFIHEYKNEYYKAIIIPRVVTEFDSIKELGSSKNRIVILKFNKDTKNVSVVSVQYIKGTYSSFTDLLVNSVFVNDVLWIIPKSSKSYEDTVSSNIPSTIYSFNISTSLFSSHNVIGLFPTNASRMNWFYDEFNKCLRCVYVKHFVTSSAKLIVDCCELRLDNISVESNESSLDITLTVINKDNIHISHNSISSEYISFVDVTGYMYNDNDFKLIYNAIRNHDVSNNYRSDTLSLIKTSLLNNSILESFDIGIGDDNISKMCTNPIYYSPKCLTKDNNISNIIGYIGEEEYRYIALVIHDRIKMSNVLCILNSKLEHCYTYTLDDSIYNISFDDRTITFIKNKNNKISVITETIPKIVFSDIYTDINEITLADHADSNGRFIDRPFEMPVLSLNHNNDLFDYRFDRTTNKFIYSTPNTTMYNDTRYNVDACYELNSYNNISTIAFKQTRLLYKTNDNVLSILLRFKNFITLYGDKIFTIEENRIFLFDNKDNTVLLSKNLDIPNTDIIHIRNVYDIETDIVTCIITLKNNNVIIMKIKGSTLDILSTNNFNIDIGYIIDFVKIDNCNTYVGIAKCYSNNNYIGFEYDDIKNTMSTKFSLNSTWDKPIGIIKETGDIYVSRKLNTQGKDYVIKHSQTLNNTDSFFELSEKPKNDNIVYTNNNPVSEHEPLRKLYFPIVYISDKDTYSVWFENQNIDRNLQTNNVGALINIHKTNKNIPNMRNYKNDIEDLKFVEHNKNRVFSYNNKLYVYGLVFDGSIDHSIYEYDFETNTFNSYSQSIHNISDLLDENVIGIKSFSDGILKIISLKKGSIDNIYLSIITFNMKTKTLVLNNLSQTIDIPITIQGASASIINILSSNKPVWLGKYFICSLTPKIDSSQNYIIRLNLENNTISIDTNNTIASKSMLEYLDGQIYSYGGIQPVGTTGIRNSSNSRKSLQYDFGILRKTSSYNISGGLSLPETSESIGVFIKNGHKLIGEIFVQNDPVDKTLLSVINGFEINKNGPSVRTNLFMGNNINSYSSILKSNMLNNPFIRDYKQSDIIQNQIESVFQVPLKDNKLVSGYIFGNGYVSNDITSLNKTSIVKLDPSVVKIIKFFNYILYIYTGLTKDTYVLKKHTVGNDPTIMQTIDIEREYGSVITGVSKFDDNKLLVFSDNSPSISTVIVHEEGSMSIKNCDGRIYGKTISSNSNVHTVQELDITLLFDKEMSEFEIRGIE